MMTRTSVWLAAALLVSITPSMAQNYQTGFEGQNGQAPTRPKLPFKRDANEFKRTILTKAPDLPDLPAYSGNAKFSTGTVSPNARSGLAFSLVYNSKDPGNTVIDWYHSALSTGKWNIVNYKTGAYVQGTKGKNYVNVQINMRSKQDSKCDIFIMYREDSSTGSR